MQADLTTFLCQFFGVLLLVSGTSMLLYPERLKSIADEFLQNTLLATLIGWIVLGLGLFVVCSHNIWNAGLTSAIITLIGWMLILKGVCVLLLPHHVLEKAAKRISSPRRFSAGCVGILLLGCYLALVGFFVSM